jgi:biotin carboxylase
MRPRVAVLHHPRSFFPLDLHQMVRDDYELLWVVGPSMAGDTPMMRLLRKLGTVVEIDDSDYDQASAALAEHRPEGIVSFVDDNVELAAQLAARLGLIYHSPQVAANLVDKRRQRKVLHGAGVAGPRFWTVPATLTGPQVKEMASDITYPAVLKPAEGSGSRGIIHLFGPDDLVVAVESDGDRGGYLIEEYLVDDLPDEWFASYFSVESVVSGGVVSHAAICGRFPLAEPFRETGNFVPGLLDPELEPDVFAMVEATTEALGIRDAVIHTEIKLTPDGPKLIEINGRLGGRPPFVLMSVSDANLFKAACAVAVGTPVHFERPVACDGVGFWLMVQPPMSARSVSSITGVAEITDLDGVDEVIVRGSAGSPVDWRQGTDSLVATVKGRAPDHGALAEVVAHVNQLLTITYAG